ncbi:NUDIX hydrolase domain-like protein [Kockovaella imperatae]|uniref:NUDIX hydrolase domain-like protein n=1 Tax=Kockovaella imperatae TaxID=4999 RepID=A0A1Y1U6C5_9TREE|nr:NUDIX hydrolase domain-like protein [Kockovaella imperatae]ORX33568.1 NUDIX hydrolase domain-like protein [Kockovaella imperatae]
MPPRSLLHIVERADNYPYPPSLPSISTSSHDPSYKTSPSARNHIPLHLSFADYLNNLPPVGLLRDQVVQAMQEEHSSQDENHEGTETVADEPSTSQSPWQFYHSTRLVPSTLRSLKTPSNNDDDDDDEQPTYELSPQCVFFADWVLQGGSERLSSVMNNIVSRWRDEGKFKSTLGGWRNEQYAVYASPQSHFFAMHDVPLSGSFANKAFTLERSACAVFGMATFGVHMTAYESDGESMRIWVPRRAKTKATFPGLLDQTVAGGIPSHLTPLESMIKECEEEASLSEDFVKSRLKSVGVSTYFYVADSGWLQPELEYLYDLKVPPVGQDGFLGMKPGDDEVDLFKLMTIPEVMTALHAKSFKPNCALILIEFLIRHGIVTPENEPQFFEICWRLRRRLEVAVPM